MGVGAGEGVDVGVSDWQCFRGVGKTRFETRAHIHKQTENADKLK